MIHSSPRPPVFSLRPKIGSCLLGLCSWRLYICTVMPRELAGGVRNPRAVEVGMWMLPPARHGPGHRLCRARVRPLPAPEGGRAGGDQAKPQLRAQSRPRGSPCCSRVRDTGHLNGALVGSSASGSQRGLLPRCICCPLLVTRRFAGLLVAPWGCLSGWFLNLGGLKLMPCELLSVL